MREPESSAPPCSGWGARSERRWPSRWSSGTRRRSAPRCSRRDTRCRPSSPTSSRRRAARCIPALSPLSAFSSSPSPCCSTSPRASWCGCRAAARLGWRHDARPAARGESDHDRRLRAGARRRAGAARVAALAGDLARVQRAVVRFLHRRARAGRRGGRRRGQCDRRNALHRRHRVPDRRPARRRRGSLSRRARRRPRRRRDPLHGRGSLRRPVDRGRNRCLRPGGPANAPLLRARRWSRAGRADGPHAGPEHGRAGAAGAAIAARSLPRGTAAVAEPAAMKAKIDVRALNAWFRTTHALRDVSLTVPENSVLAIIGPSGCGKSTFVRCINRMHELVPGARQSGQVLVDGQDLHARRVDPVNLRRRVGMVFQRPNPFPTMSIFDNVIAGLRLNGVRGDYAEVAENSLRQAALWDEVKDRLQQSALSLSGGQQQRLCIARALSIEPEVLLMDEPASALDPIATAKIEELIHELRASLTIVIVTHNMQQAARVSDATAFFYLGELIEHGATEQIFTNPREPRTEDYVTGKFG